MNIEIIHINKDNNFDECFQADCEDCPGSPPVGYGKTREEAVAALFFLMMFGSTRGPSPTNWLKYIKQDEPIVIDGKVWKNPCKTQR